MRYLKTLGLAIVAMFAMGAVMATAASAQQGVFTTDGPATITGEEDPENPLVFAAGLGITCETEEFHAELSSASEDLTLFPNYELCSAPPFGGATVDMTGCDFNLYDLETNEEGPFGTYLATAALECPENKQVDIDVPAIGCRITVPAQNGLEHVKFWNTPGESSSTDDIDMLLTVGGITTTRENLGESTCAVGHAHGTTATYSGGITLTGEDEEEEHVGIRISD